MPKPNQGNYRAALKVIEHLEPEWEQVIIKQVKSNQPLTPETVAMMRGVGQAMGWLKSKISSELQPVDNSTEGEVP